MKSSALSVCVCRWAVRLLVLAALTAVLVPVSVARADSVVTFADSDLEDAVREALGKTSGEDIYESDIGGMTVLEASGRGISSLSGLEGLQDVTYVDLSNNQITSLSPLGNIAWANSILLGHNQITSIAPLSGISVSDVLDLSYNKISGFSSLTDFGAGDLNLSHNNIINIGPLVTGSGNRIGEYLNLEGNDLDCDAHNTYIPMLVEDGVSVLWDYIYPDRPINQSPANGATVDSLTPTLRASAYHDKNGGDHTASAWRVIAEDETLVWESGLTSPAATSITVPEGELYPFSTYYWEVGYKNSSVWSCYSKRTSFTTPAPDPDPGPVPLGVITGSASSLSAASATLNGTLDGLGYASSVQVYFQWGTTTAYSGGTTDAQTMTHAGAFSASVSPLAALTTYHFRAVAEGDSTVYGGDVMFTTPASGNLAPAAPANLSPASGAQNVIPTPVLQASAFSDPDTGDYHAASWWQVRSDTGSYDSPAWASTTAGTTSTTVPADVLKHFKKYYWRVRYQDSRGAWSEYSPETSFTTADFVYADQPLNLSPVAGVTEVSLTPVLQASAYNQAEGFPHIACSWQVWRNGGSSKNPDWESGLSSPAGSSITVPAGELAYSTLYFWRVGYQDSRGLWSKYSEPTSFKTLISPVLQVTTVSADGVGARSATLRLSLGGMGSTSPVQVYFEWGATEAYGTSTPATAMTSAGPFTYDLTSLQPETAYHFRAVAVGDATVYGSDLTFSTLAGNSMPPAVNTGDAQATASGSIQLKGELSYMGTAPSVSVSFVWGTKQGGPYLNETVGSERTSIGGFEAELSGLAPATTYYYKARGVGDGTGYGVEVQFTTGGLQPVLRSVMADNGRQGDELTVTITGTNLDGATAVTFGDGVMVNRLQVMSASVLTVDISIDSGAAKGLRDVAVTTPRGTGTMGGGFEVKEGEARTRLWVYLAAGAGGILGLGVLGAVLALVLRKRPAPLGPGATRAAGRP